MPEPTGTPDAAAPTATFMPPSRAFQTERKGAYTMTMMQTTIVYDTHAAVLRLTKTGMPEPQAAAVVREQSLLLEHNLATKADIELVKADIEALRQETKAEIATAKNGIIMWVVGLNMAMVGLMIAAVKFL